MEVLKRISSILPPIDFVETLLKENPMELVIIKQIYGILNQFLLNEQSIEIRTLNDIYAMVDGIKDHLWEVLNTGNFINVQKIDRQRFTLASLEKALLLLLKGHFKLIDPNEAREKCTWELDNGLLLGCPLPHPSYCNLLSDCLNNLQNTDANVTPNGAVNSSTLITKEDLRLPNENCDLEILKQPSIQHFKENYFNCNQPVILEGCMSQWPAMTKWNQVTYLLDVCRNRVVPIEIGKNYTTETWSQDLIKFDEFFRRQFMDDEASSQSKRVEYLAQHNLFDQIPALQSDILTPEYCCLSNRTDDAEIDVDIKAWLGPEGTTSPMHIDAKHNLLCQVFGSKYIILAAPEDSTNLYPFDGDMLKNTSQIDAEHLDYDRFPLLRNVKFYRFTLHKGEMLYIPPKWWHFVRSLSKSFSVSFWWE